MQEELSTFTEENASHVLRELYGLRANLTPLPSEYDSNFHAVTRDGEAFVFKLMRAGYDRRLIDLQCRVLEHLARTVPAVCLPRVHMTLAGDVAGSTIGSDGQRHLVWMLSYVPGRLLAQTKPHTPELLLSLGRFLAHIDSALSDFSDPVAHRDLKWDLARSGWIRHYLHYIPDRSRRALVERFLDRYEEDVITELLRLPSSVIHGDANDFNVLVSEPSEHPRRVISLIDFGDVMHTQTICEVATAAAYALLDKRDPLTVASYVVAGYNEIRPLREDEIALLFPLICTRLCVSVTNSAYRRATQSDDPYVTISEKPAWSALDRLATVHPRFAHYMLRRACGLEPVPHAQKVVNWLRESRDAIASILDVDLRSAPCVVFDLGVGSQILGADPRAAETAALTETLFREMQDAHVAVGVGRYDEARLIYTSPEFASGPHPTDEHRTIHLGLDLFLAAGTAISAPLEGIVECIANNARHKDFGPLIILRHSTRTGQDFYTLYCHLDESSLASLRVGQSVERGQQIGTVGTPPANGDWPPHVHVQIVTDLLDLDNDFPGVAYDGQRELWLSLCPDPNLLVGIPAERFPSRQPTKVETMNARRSHIGFNLSLSYEEPLKIVRGWMQYLYDETGRAYLDLYNNVAHVGHSHPRVVEAVRCQLALLNTNTRCLHDSLARYAERLSALMPDPLQVCFFVNSASEGNELALRLARTHTKQNVIIVLGGAYHGHTTSLIDVSPYKFNGPGGDGPKPWVHTAPIADDYRGPYKRDDPDAGKKYAEHVAQIIQHLTTKGSGPAAFLVESLPSVAGQIVFPPGYLADAFEHVRSAGAVCIADEVQVGFGRSGTHFWGFETQGVVPDIVVLGKPIGNGFPLGAVITTREIASSFDNGMEFFSTFGGNPVACAAGLAVLDVMQQERLQDNALSMGDQLMSGLRGSMERYPLIGDVRGVGLFVGVELVRSRETLEPAPREAAYVVNRLRERGILTGTDGSFRNVIKIKPPLVVDRDDIDRFLTIIDRVLQEDAVQVG